MSDQTTLENSCSATSSRASESGVTHSAKPDGQTTGPCGQVPALASLSAWQAWAVGLTTSGTYGLTGSTSSSSAALAQSLVSRLKLRSAMAGSTLFKLTWKESVTPSHRSVYLLRASARRRSDKGCGSLLSWPTPQAIDRSGKGRAGRLKKDCNRDPNAAGSYRMDLKDSVLLASWPTCRANDAEKRGQVADDKRNGLVSAANMASWPTCAASDGTRAGTLTENMTGTSLPQAVKSHLAAWPTTSTRDHKGGYGGGRMRDGKISLDTLDVVAQLAMPARLTASGEMLTGSSAKMESGGQLNPAHSRWLMGLPPEWDACAPTVTPSRRTRQSK